MEFFCQCYILLLIISSGTGQLLLTLFQTTSWKRSFSIRLYIFLSWMFALNFFVYELILMIVFEVKYVWLHLGPTLMFWYLTLDFMDEIGNSSKNKYETWLRSCKIYYNPRQVKYLCVINDILNFDYEGTC